MKNFLRYSIPILLIHFLVSICLAKGDMQFYVNILSLAGVTSTAYVDPVTAARDNISTRQLNENIVASASSILNVDALLERYPSRRLFIVCDTFMQLDSISCDYNKVYSSDISQQSVYNNLTYVVLLRNNTTIYFIPEQYFTYPNYQENLIFYLRTISKSSTPSVQVLTQDESSTIVLLKTLSLALVLLFMFYLLLRRPLSKISYYPSVIMSARTYIKAIQSVLYTIKSNRSFYLSILFILFGLYFVIGLILTAGSGITVTLPYLLQIIVSTFNFTEVEGFVENRQLLPLFIAAITYLSGILLSFVLLPDLLTNMIDTYKGLHKLQGKTPHINVVFLFLFLLITLILGIFSVKTVSLILFCLVLSAILIWCKASKDFATSLRLLMLGSSIFLFVIGSLVNYYFVSRPVTVVHEELFKNAEGRVVLPYIKDYTNTTFLPFIVNPNFPLFVNSYLVSDPQFSSILNKPWKDFDPETPNYYFLFKARAVEYIRFINDSPQLLPLFTSSKFEGIFLVQNMDTKRGDPEMTIVLNCAYLADTGVVKMMEYTREYTAEKTVLNYPKCNPDENYLEFKVPFVYSVTGGPKLYEVEDTAAKVVADIRVHALDGSSSTELPSIVYLHNSAKEYMYIKHLTDVSQPLISYGSDVKSNFYVHSSNSNFDLSTVINDLTIKHLISSPITLWSQSEGLVLQEIKE